MERAPPASVAPAAVPAQVRWEEALDDGVPLRDAPRRAARTDEVGRTKSSASLVDKATTGFLVNDMLTQDLVNEAGGPEAKAPGAPKKKGWVSGVFVPTCENMWGVLIFLRFHYIVGQAGVLQTMLAVLVSFVAALCTTASMSSIASSGGIVSGGGPYHMISRSLGPVVGVSVGLMYWLAITLLAVLECLGAVEALVMAVPSLAFPFHMQAIGSAFLAALALFVGGGINVVTKLGVVFAAIVFFTLFSYYFGIITSPHGGGRALDDEYITGISGETLLANLGPHYLPGVNFGTVLGLFYPCFTGILSGANRAAVLKDPPKDIRRGTFAAVCFSFAMYVSLFLLWGSVADYRYLQDTGPEEIGLEAVRDIVWNPFPYAAFIGVICASLSQSMQCLIVAPRLMQQIASDNILPVLAPLGALSSKSEPVRALLFTYFVGALLVLLGQLELVAPLLSICFLIAYSFMNCSCFVLTWLRSPAWRPKWIRMKRWRVWYMVLACLGFVVCIGIMLVINLVWSAVGWAMALSLYFYVNWMLETREWGSAVHGIKYSLALKQMIDLESSQEQNVNWRPQVLILYRINVEEERNGIKHREILSFHSQLRKSGGFCVVACVLESARKDERAMRKAREEKDMIKGIMKEEGIQGFADVVVAPTWAEGADYVIQLSGVGGLVPNTVMVDWPEDWERHADAARDFASIVSTSLAAEKSVLAVKYARMMPTEAVHGTIDIWWMIHDGGLMILLAWLLSQHRTWRHCHLRVFTVAENVSRELAEGAAAMLTRKLQQHRLFDLDVEVVLLDEHMIEPYTRDWTLRVEERNRFLQQLHNRSVEPVPMELDDLFSEENPWLCAAARGSPRSASGSSSPTADARITVSDCRSGCDRGESERAGQPGPGRVHEFRSVAAAGAACGRSCSAEAADGAAGDEATPVVQRPLPWECLETSEQLGKIIFARSKRAQLVVMNLPNLWGTESEDVLNFMKYCDTLTQGLERVLFVHSTGHEIFDISG